MKDKDFTLERNEAASKSLNGEGKQMESSSEMNAVRKDEPKPGSSFAKRKHKLIKDLFDSSCDSLLDSEPEQSVKKSIRKSNRRFKVDGKSKSAISEKKSSKTEKFTKVEKSSKRDKSSKSSSRLVYEGKNSSKGEIEVTSSLRTDWKPDPEDFTFTSSDEEENDNSVGSSRSKRKHSNSDSDEATKKVSTEDKPEKLDEASTKPKERKNAFYDSDIERLLTKEQHALLSEEDEKPSEPRAVCVPPIMKRPTVSKQPKAELSKKSKSSKTKRFSFGLKEKTVSKPKSELKKVRSSKAKRFSFGLEEKAAYAKAAKLRDKKTDDGKVKGKESKKAVKRIGQPSATVVRESKPRSAKSKADKIVDSSEDEEVAGGSKTTRRSRNKKKTTSKQSQPEKAAEELPEKPTKPFDLEKALRDGEEFKKRDRILDQRLKEADEQYKALQEFKKASRAADEAFRRENLIMRDRLADELKEEDIRSMVRDNFAYLEGVWRGRIPSDRHDKYKVGGGAKLSLLYTMITDPFTDEQLQWTADEMTKRWMPSKELIRQHDDYVWKVLIPECFTKMYMEYFNIPSRAEAIDRIRGTPIRPGPDGLGEY